MHHGEIPLHVHHRPRAHPVDEFFRIRSAEHIVERIVGALALEAFVLGQQMQVVIAEHHHRAIAQFPDESQHLQRLRPAVDQVADEPQPVAPTIEAHALEQCLQLVVAALHVADRIRSHRERL